MCVYGYVYIHVAINNSIIVWILNEGLVWAIKCYFNQFKLVLANYSVYSYIKIIQLVFIGFMNKISREIINIDKCYYIKTIKSTAEGYFYSCKVPCAGQYVLELQVSSVATDIGIDVELKTFAKPLRKTQMYINLLYTYVTVNSRYL